MAFPRKNPRPTAKAKPATTPAARKSPPAGAGRLRDASPRFRAVRSGFRLSQAAMARALGISPRKLCELENAARQPRLDTRRRLNEIQRLYDALTQLMDEADLAGWLEEPNDAFEGAAPLHLIERGEIDRLWQMIFSLRTGHPI